MGHPNTDQSASFIGFDPSRVFNKVWKDTHFPFQSKVDECGPMFLIIRYQGVASGCMEIDGLPVYDPLATIGDFTGGAWPHEQPGLRHTPLT
jgi:hypothetical protein